MKKIITILLLFFSWNFFAQKITISEGFTIRSDDQYDFIGKIKNQYLIFQDKGTDFEIRAFDRNLSPSWNKEIELEKRRTNDIQFVVCESFVHFVSQNFA